MQPGCLRHSEVPHASRLFLDYLYHFDRVAGFYGWHYQDPAAFAAAAREIEFPADRRAALVAALRAFNGASPQLEQLARPGAVAVVTGQQVGLFGGPMYTVYKALTAARLAAQLSEQGIPAVPVFWLATEDHDFNEVNHTWVFDGRTQPRRIAVQAAGDHRPAGEVIPESYPLDGIEALFDGFPYGTSALETIGRSYAPGRNMGSAFHAFLREILGAFPFVYVDPMQAEIRRIAAPLLREAAGRGPELTEALLRRNGELTAAGYHAQVHLEPKSSLFFVLRDGRRIAIRRNGDFYEGPDGQLDEAGLADYGERLSPNALLRPVMQDYLLPAVAQVAGPAELTYLAQTRVLHQALLGRGPVIVPRCAFTLIEERAAKLTARYGLTHQEFFGGPEAVREGISRKLIPPGLRDAVGSAREQVAGLLAALERETAAFDPTLAAATAKSRSKMLHQVEKIEAKIARESVRRDERAASDADYLNGLLYPNKHLQERVYSILPFLARHGMGLVDHVYQHVRLECPDHIVLPV
jgi:bacillithiol synthase